MVGLIPVPRACHCCSHPVFSSRPRKRSVGDGHRICWSRPTSL